MGTRAISTDGRTREEGLEVANAGFARREIDKYDEWTKKGRKKERKR
jgi:hypothetical protein